LQNNYFNKSLLENIFFIACHFFLDGKRQMGFNFLKIPVHIHSSFWFFLLLFSFDPGFSVSEIFILGLVLTISFLFHEYGHALTAIFFGAKPEINLHAFSGHTTYYKNDEITRKQNCLIMLSGPLFTFFLILCSHHFLKANFFDFEHMNIFFYYMLKLNTLWFIINFFPLEPLDGGKILVYLLNKKMGEQKSLKISRSIGNVAALIGASYFLSHGHYFFGTLFLFFGFNNLQKTEASENKEGCLSHRKI